MLDLPRVSLASAEAPIMRRQLVIALIGVNFSAFPPAAPPATRTGSLHVGGDALGTRGAEVVEGSGTSDSDKSWGGAERPQPVIFARSRHAYDPQETSARLARSRRRDTG